MMLNIISMSVLYLNRVSAKFGVTWHKDKRKSSNNLKFLDIMEFKVQQHILLLPHCFWECEVNVSVYHYLGFILM